MFFKLVQPGYLLEGHVVSTEILSKEILSRFAVSLFFYSPFPWHLGVAKILSGIRSDWLIVAIYGHAKVRERIKEYCR